MQDTLRLCHLWRARLYSIVPHYLIKGTFSGKKLLNIKCLFLFSLQISSEHFLFREELGEIWSKMYFGLHIKYVYQLFLSDSNEIWNFLYIFSKNTAISNLMKTLSMGAEFFHTDGRTDMKLIVAFRNFSNEPKKCSHNAQKTFCNSL